MSLSMRLGRDAIASSLIAAVAVVDVAVVARMPGWKVEGENTCFIATRETTNRLLVGINMMFRSPVAVREATATYDGR